MIKNQNDSLLKKWEDAIAKIANEMGQLLKSRHIFNETRDIVVPKKSLYMASYLSWIADLYVARLSVGVRRIIDTYKAEDFKTFSLLSLLNNIKKNQNVLTRSVFCDRWSECQEDNDDANNVFNRFADEESDKLNIEWLNKDIAVINNETKHIKTFIDKWVVHHDLKRKQNQVPTFGDVDSALQLLDNIICKYHLLLCGSDLSGSCMPILKNWKRIVNQVWIAKGQ